jgi:hypothetical protein
MTNIRVGEFHNDELIRQVQAALEETGSISMQFEESEGKQVLVVYKEIRE